MTHKYVQGGYSFYQIGKGDLQKLFDDASMKAVVKDTEFIVKSGDKVAVDQLLQDNNVLTTKPTELLETNIPLNENFPI